MATLAQYSAALHDAQPVERRSPGVVTRWTGVAIHAAAVLLVALAALQSAV